MRSEHKSTEADRDLVEGIAGNPVTDQRALECILGLLSFLVFFFGVWGGVETGRYLEAWMSKRHA
jgi:hypothetical protein